MRPSAIDYREIPMEDRDRYKKYLMYFACEPDASKADLSQVPRKRSYYPTCRFKKQRTLGFTDIPIFEKEDPTPSDRLDAIPYIRNLRDKLERL